MILYGSKNELEQVSKVLTPVSKKVDELHPKINFVSVGIVSGWMGLGEGGTDLMFGAGGVTQSKKTTRTHA